MGCAASKPEEDRKLGSPGRVQVVQEVIVDQEHDSPDHSAADAAASDRGRECHGAVDMATGNSVTVSISVAEGLCIETASPTALESIKLLDLAGWKFDAPAASTPIRAPVLHIKLTSGRIISLQCETAQLITQV
eukprot:SAG31_NODE_15246_length_764_cov_0.590977_1_plen_133_part_10